MDMEKYIEIHPTIKKCMKHLDVIQADDKTKQIVYMYMESLMKELKREQN
jgi:hypothetical protein